MNCEVEVEIGVHARAVGGQRSVKVEEEAVEKMSGAEEGVGGGHCSGLLSDCHGRCEG